MHRCLILIVLTLAVACQKPPEPGESRGSTTPRFPRESADASPLTKATQPVRIGEQGPNFAACGARATTRSRTEALTVRAAPYEASQAIGAVAAGAGFSICARSIDQGWFGIVYDSGGRVSDACGVSRPIPAPRDYPGPCRAGWVASGLVRPVG